MKCTLCHEEFNVGMKSSTTPNKEEFKYLELYTDNYELKIQRRVLFPIIVPLDVDPIPYDNVEKFRLEEDTTFRELHSILKRIIPASYMLDDYRLGDLVVNDRRVDLNDIIRNTVGDLENTILYADYHPILKMMLDNGIRTFNVKFTTNVTWNQILEGANLQSNNIVLRSDNEPPIRNIDTRNRVFYTVPRFSSLVNPILSIT